MLQFLTPTPVNTDDELLPQLHSWNGQPITSLLLPVEIAARCQVYRVPNNVHAPALKQGDLIVAQPLAIETWAAIAPGAFCLLRIQYNEAEDNSWEPFQAHHISRITGNGLRFGGTLVGLHDDEACFPSTPIETKASDLLAVYRLVRLIRSL